MQRSLGHSAHTGSLDPRSCPPCSALTSSSVRAVATMSRMRTSSSLCAGQNHQGGGTTSCGRPSDPGASHDCWMVRKPCVGDTRSAAVCATPHPVPSPSLQLQETPATPCGAPPSGSARPPCSRRCRSSTAPMRSTGMCGCTCRSEASTRRATRAAHDAAACPWTTPLTSRAPSSNCHPPSSAPCVGATLDRGPAGGCCRGRAVTESSQAVCAADT